MSPTLMSMSFLSEWVSWKMVAAKGRVVNNQRFLNADSRK
jgi:hypothetical protein